MSEQKKRWLFIGALCLLVLALLVVGICLFLSNKNPTKDYLEVQTPTDSNTTPQEGTPTNPDKENADQQENENPSNVDRNENQPQDETVTPPNNVPPQVEIPSQDEILGLQFPCEVPGHNLQIQQLAPYSGLFVEDGTNRQITDVAMLLIYNSGDTAVEYTEITIEYEAKNLVFQITALPAGEKMVVQEKSGSAIPEGVAVKASVLVIHRAQMSIAPGLSVTDNGDNSLTIKNLTGETIPAVRVFYKYFMKDENLFVGGIAFTVRVTSLGPNGSVVVHPSHYNSQTSCVVMALTYDE